MTWATGGAQTDYAYGTTNSCVDGTTSNAYLDVSGLTANTSVTRYACARNGDTDKTSALTIGPYYTTASTPNVPTLSNPKTTTIDVNPATGGAEKDMAIYVTKSAGTCSSGSGGEGYVQYSTGAYAGYCPINDVKNGTRERNIRKPMFSQMSVRSVRRM